MEAGATSIAVRGLAPQFDARTFVVITEASMDPQVHAASVVAAQRGKKFVEFITKVSFGAAHPAFILNTAPRAAPIQWVALIATSHLANG